MSIAIRCNGCDAFFDPHHFKGEFVTIKQLTYQTDEQYRLHEYGYYDEELHLCPICAHTLSLLLSGKELVEKNSWTTCRKTST